MTDEELLIWLRVEDTNLTDFAANRIEELIEESGRRLALARSEGVARVEQFERNEALTKERDDYAHKLMKANNTYTEMHLEIERLSDKLAKALEALLWCSGSADFNEGGVAREGWLKLCAPLLKGDTP